MEAKERKLTQTTYSGNRTIFVAELRLLNSIVANPSLIADYSLNEDLLVHSSAKSVFTSIEQLSSEKIPLTSGSIFQRMCTIDIDADLSLVEAVLKNEFEYTDVLDDVVADLKYARNKQKIAEKLDKIKALMAGGFMPSDENIVEMKQLLTEADTLLQLKDNKLPVQTMEQWMDSYEEEFITRRNGKRYLFGDKNLDDLVTYGPAPGGGGLVVAATGMAKTSFIVHLTNQFINADIPVMLYELEMSGVSCMDRLLSMRLGIPNKTIVNPPSVEDFDSVYSAIKDERETLISHKNFRFSENPSIWIADLKNDIRKFQKEIGQDYCIVMLDLLSMVKDFCNLKPGLSLAGQMEMAINQLNELAKECGIHYMGTVQLNRTVEQDKVHDIDDISKLKPTRSAVKNSGALLERARYCLSLFRPKYYADLYLEDDEEAQLIQDIVHVKLLKQNDGATGGYKMLFDPETFTMATLENEEFDEEE